MERKIAAVIGTITILFTFMVFIVVETTPKMEPIIEYTVADLEVEGCYFGGDLRKIVPVDPKVSNKAVRIVCTDAPARYKLRDTEFSAPDTRIDVWVNGKPEIVGAVLSRFSRMNPEEIAAALAVAWVK